MTTPSRLRRAAEALARLGIDLRPPVRRARDFLLWPVRREAAADNAARARIEATLSAQLAETRDRLAAREAELGALRRELAALRAAQEEVWNAAAARIGALEQELPRIARLEQDAPRLDLLEHLAVAGPFPDSGDVPPQVSIILPTRDRAALLAEAVASVRAQHFRRWELIVVDDGSAEDIAAALAPFAEDPRIRLVRQPPRGAAAARNHGLALATAAWVAFLDSDNLWFPGFLAGALAALRDEDAIVYGVLASDAHGMDRPLLWRDFDRVALERANFIDLNAVLIRRDVLADIGGFDTALDRLQDWDMLLRATAHRPARALPVLAARYRAADGRRISDRVPFAPAHAAVQAKLWPPPTLRRPRVLYVVWHYPQLSESYLNGEIACMRRWGVEVEVWRSAPPAAWVDPPAPFHDGTIAEAAARFRPDIVHVHWTSFTQMLADQLAALNLPVTVRVHGFEGGAGQIRAMLAYPWMRAVFAFPHQVAQHAPDPRLIAVPVAFDSTLFRPHADKDRRLVLRAGAALPNKDIFRFLDLARRLPRYRFVFAGVTCTHQEAYVDVLRQEHARLASPADLRFDVPRDEMAALMGQAGTYLHTLPLPGAEGGAPIGMPISIAEAMATGAHVLARDTPELAAYVGDAGSLYRDSDHAAALLGAMEGWSDAAWRAAWTRSVERAFTHHADVLTLRPILASWAGMVG